MAGALYQALAKNMFLEPVANVIGKYLQKKREEEAVQKYIENIQNMQTGIKDIYADKTANPNRGVQPQGTLLPQLVDPNNTIDNSKLRLPKTVEGFESDLEGQPPVEVQKPKNFIDLRGTTPLTLAEKNKMANERLINFLMNQMTDKDVPAETKQYGSSLLQQLIQSQQPPKTEIKSFGMTEDVYKIDSAGNMTLVKEGRSKNPRQQDLWKKRGEGVKDGKKYAIMENIETGDRREIELGEKNAGTTVNINTPGNDYNYSNLYANLQTGIKVIDNLKKAKLEKDDKGILQYFPPGSGTSIPFSSQEDFDKYKESIKNQYTNDAIELVNQRGLDGPVENTPVKNIRQQLGKGYTIDEALSEFKKQNPDFPEKDFNLMKDYFTLMMK